MTFKEHVLLTYPDAVAEEIPRVEGKKREWVIKSNGKKLVQEYSEAKAWKELMMKLEESSDRMKKNGFTRKNSSY